MKSQSEIEGVLSQEISNRENNNEDINDIITQIFTGSATQVINLNDENINNDNEEVENINYNIMNILQEKLRKLNDISYKNVLKRNGHYFELNNYDIIEFDNGRRLELEYSDEGDEIIIFYHYQIL